MAPTALLRIREQGIRRHAVVKSEVAEMWLGDLAMGAAPNPPNRFPCMFSSGESMNNPGMQ